MKLALLLPGYLDSPDYAHMLHFQSELESMGYVVHRVDPCHLWERGDISQYTLSNYIAQIRQLIEQYSSEKPEEVVLIGHSLGGLVAIIAGARIEAVTSVVSLCPPADLTASAKKWQPSGVRHSQRDLPDNPAQFRSFDVPQTFVDDALQYSAKEEVKALTKPLMLFIALDDDVVLPASTEAIAANAHSADVIRQPNMGHSFRHFPDQTAVVMREIVRFLQKGK